MAPAQVHVDTSPLLVKKRSANTSLFSPKKIATISALIIGVFVGALAVTSVRPAKVDEPALLGDAQSGISESYRLGVEKLYEKFNARASATGELGEDDANELEKEIADLGSGPTKIALIKENDVGYCENDKVEFGTLMNLTLHVALKKKVVHKTLDVKKPPPGPFPSLSAAYKMLKMEDFGTVPVPVTCDVDFFGEDPAPGKQKFCKCKQKNRAVTFAEGKIGLCKKSKVHISDGNKLVTSDKFKKMAIPLPVVCTAVQGKIIDQNSEKFGETILTFQGKIADLDPGAKKKCFCHK
jgi:hypothetical protein